MADLTERQTKEFQALYEEVFGERISFEKAYERGLDVLEIFEVLLRRRADKKDNPDKQ
ncbi:MAG: hypothetical protein ACOCUF_01145 [Patescibacteria group bacterium]